MGKRQICAVVWGVMMLTGAVMGCGSTTAQGKETVAVGENTDSAVDTTAAGESTVIAETAAATENAAPAENTTAETGKMKLGDGEPGGRQQRDGATIIQITAIDGDTITGVIGELRPGKPEGDKPDGAPEGDKADGASEPPAGGKPDGGQDHPGRDDMKHPGDGKRGRDGGPRGGEFTATEGTLTFTLAEDTVIVVESVEGSENTTPAELAVGDVLEVVLDDNEQPVTVTVIYTGN